MKERNLITIPIEVEHFLSFILGKRSTHGLAGHHSRSDWKKYLKRLFTHFEKYVRANVVTDNPHYRQITYTIDQFKKAIDSEVGETVLIASLFKLCFLLMGDIPDHWRKKVVNRPEYFMLDKFRSVHFSQSPKQKADLIVKTYIEPKLRNGTEGNEAKKVWVKYFRVYDKQKRHSEFIEWFRKKYPDKYVKLFS